MDDSRKLIQQASGGDPRAVDSLLERHLPRLRAYVRLRMGEELRRKESASDLVQSACREVLQHLDRYRYQGESNFRHWLFTTALRKIRNRYEYYRAHRRDIAREERDPAGDDAGLAQHYQTLSTPSRRLVSQERIAQIEAAFDRLPEHHREVITLSRIVGLSHPEIAKVMGRTVWSTRSLLYRALTDLAEMLGEPT